MSNLMWTDAGMVEFEHGVYGQCTKCNIKLALELALLKLYEFEPGDSRAVSDEFVAMAAVLSDANTADDCMDIIRQGIARYTVKG